MHLAVKIGQLEVRCLERCERGTTRRRSLAEIPHAVFVIMHDRLAGYKRPKEYVVIVQLPHTATGKVQRNLIPGLLPTDGEQASRPAPGGE